MDKVERFSVSIEPELLKGFDEHISRKGYGKRSEAIRDLIRDALVKEKWETGKEQMSGTITIVYEHQASGVTNTLMDVQHSHCGEIHSTTHVHLDADTCLEVLIVSGKPSDIKKLADRLASIKGVHNAELVMTGKALSHSHAHGHNHKHRH